MRNILALALLLGGCSEYEVHDPNAVVYGEPNGKPLENIFVVEEFAHPTPAPADVLVAVDQSCSMGDNWTEWANNMPDFVNILDDNYIDYHLGVMGTGSPDPNNVGTLPWWNGVQWAERTDFNPVTTFTALEGNISQYSEAGIDAVHALLTDRREDGSNNGFLRQNVPLHVVTISDEPDQSLWAEPGDLYEAMKKYEWNYNTTVTYSVIVHLPNSPLCTPWAWQTGDGYIQLAAQWGRGQIIDICRTDWSQPIQEIANYIGQNVNYEYYLSNVPVPDTIEVYVIEEVNGQEVTFVFDHVDDWQEGDWEFCREEECYQPTWLYDQQRNSIVFPDFVPDYDTKVRVEYFDAVQYDPDQE